MTVKTPEPVKRLAWLEQLSDERAELPALAQRAKCGDEDALTTIYLRYFDRVYGYMSIALTDSERAAEAAQEVFLEVARSIAAYDHRDSLTSWLFEIAHREAFQRLRASDASADSRRTEAEESTEAGAMSETDGLRALLWTSDTDLTLLIERLPEAQRRALVLGHVLGFSTAEIAETMGLTTLRVRELQHVALGFLEHRLRSLSREPSAGSRRLAMRIRGRCGPRPAHGFTLAPR